MDIESPRNQNWLQTLLGFHDDEDGMETLQIVMIIAVAAIILITVKIFWGNIKSWAQGLLSQITGWTS